MAIERLVGLYVNDLESYQTYREKMTPILHQFGGNFGYDFKIEEVLKSETEDPINRVFTIHFPDEKSLENFFSNEEYLKIKNTYFEPAVSNATIIAKYPRD